LRNFTFCVSALVKRFPGHTQQKMYAVQVYSKKYWYVNKLYIKNNTQKQQLNNRYHDIWRQKQQGIMGKKDYKKDRYSNSWKN